VFFGALFSPNLQVAGFAAKQAAIEAGSDASSAKIAIKEWAQLPYPHDPALAPDGALWYTGQESNTLGSPGPCNRQGARVPVEDTRLRPSWLGG